MAQYEHLVLNLSMMNGWKQKQFTMNYAAADSNVMGLTKIYNYL